MTIDLVLTDKIDEIISNSEFLEIKELVIAKNFSNTEEIDSLREKSKNSKVNFYFCHVITKMDSSQVKKFRQKADLIAVQGGDIPINKFAVSNKLVDILLMPCDYHKLTFDTALARLAKQSNVTIGILFSDFLNTKTSFERTMLFKQYLFTTKIAQKIKVETVFFSGAKKTSEMRAPEDLFSFGAIFGFTKQQSKRFLENIKRKIKEVKE